MNYFSSDVEIGSQVKVQVDGSNQKGVLICHSALGLSALDVFNEIITSSADHEAFLKQNNVDYISGESALSIQAYLTFCYLTNQTPWSVNVFNPSDISDIDFVAETETKPVTEPFELHVKNDSAPPSRRTELTEQEVVLACEICTKSPDPLLHVTQGLYDKSLENHMKHVHNKKTDVALCRDQDEDPTLNEIEVPEPVEVDGNLKFGVSAINHITSQLSSFEHPITVGL